MHAVPKTCGTGYSKSHRICFQISQFFQPGDSGIVPDLLVFLETYSEISSSQISHQTGIGALYSSPSSAFAFCSTDLSDAFGRHVQFSRPKNQNLIPFYFHLNLFAVFSLNLRSLIPDVDGWNSIVKLAAGVMRQVLRWVAESFHCQLATNLFVILCFADSGRCCWHCRV